MEHVAGSGKKMPRFIKNKIIFIKLTAFLQIAVSFLILLVLTFCLLLRYYNEYEKGIAEVSQFFVAIFNKVNATLNIDIIPYPFLLYFFFIIFAFLFLYGGYNLIMIIKQAKKYRLLLKNNEETIPEFIYGIYKKSLIYKIVAKGFCSFYYIIAIIILAIMISLQYLYLHNENKKFMFGFGEIAELKSLTSEIIIVSASILVVLFFHCFSYIHAKKIKTQIISYGNKDILTSEEKKHIINKTNGICFVIIAILVTVALFIIYLVIKKGRCQKQ